MKLLKKFSEDMKAFMLDKQSLKDKPAMVAALNVLLAEISVLKNKLLNAEKEKKSELTIQEEHKVVKKEIEETTVALEEFTRGQRDDLIKESNSKIALLTKYLKILEEDMPKQLDEAEIAAEVLVVMNDLIGSDKDKVFTKKETGLLMKELKVRLDGRADMKIVSKILSSVLV